ncbi:MAG: cell division protein ZapA [Bacteriovoracia bacterium]
MANAHSFEFEFLGQKIQLKSEGDPEMIREVTDLAAMKLRDANVRSKGAAAHKVALVALLDLAEEYVRAKRKATDHRAEVTEKSKKLLSAIESSLSSSASGAAKSST